jgi:hypothetical protein
VCLCGKKPGPEVDPMLPEVGLNEAFVACFDRTGLTRVRTWYCGGASFGARQLAVHPSGDLFVTLPDECGDHELTAISILRLDASLSTRAMVPVTPTEGPMPYVRIDGLGATEEHVVVAGRMRGETTIGAETGRGPFAAVLAAEDLSLVHLISSPPSDADPPPEAHIGHAAVREDGATLLFGKDHVGGAFRAEGGVFVRVLDAHTGALTSISEGDEPRFHHRYGVAWHPDGRPTAIGTQGGRHLAILLGSELHTLDTSYASRPYFAYRGAELLIARPMFDSGHEIAGRVFDGERWGGFLVGADATSFEALWAQGLPGPYNAYRPIPLLEGMAVVSSADSVSPGRGFRIAFFSPRAP